MAAVRVTATAAAAAILVLVLLLALAATAEHIGRERTGRYEKHGRREGGEPGRGFFHGRKDEW